MAVSPPAPESKGSVSEGNPESEDLKKFRQEWFQELRKRNAMRTLDEGTAGTSAILPSQAENSQNVANRSLVTNVDKSKELWKTSDHPLISDGEIRGQDDMPPSLRRALDIYRRAVSHEQIGELDEALTLYRQAFRLV